MDASSTPASSEDTNVQNFCSYFLKSHNSVFPDCVKQRNSTIKYTKLPDFDFDTTDAKHPVPSKKLNKAVGEGFKDVKQQQKCLPNRMNYSSKSSKSVQSAKLCNLNNKNEVNVCKTNYKAKNFNVNNQRVTDNLRNKSIKDNKQPNQITNLIKQRQGTKKVIETSENMKEVYTDNLKKSLSSKAVDKTWGYKSPIQDRRKLSFSDITSSKYSPIPIIHAPLERRFYQKPNQATEDILLENVQEKDVSKFPLQRYSSNETASKVDCATETDSPKSNSKRDKNVDCIVKKVDKSLGMDINDISTNSTSTDIVETCEKGIDCLEIPNVTLSKEFSKGNNADICTKISPSIYMPSFVIASQKDDLNSLDPKIRKCASLIIGRATLTYTTRQKINFHVVSSNEETTASLSPSPLAYPINVVSVFKRKIKTIESTGDVNPSSNENDVRRNSAIRTENSSNKAHTLNYHRVFNCNKLVKPSDMINSMGVNNGLLQNEHMWDQFQRELNFVDSFFESLQYLEQSSLAEKCFSDTKCEGWLSKLDVKNSNYRSFVTNVENGLITEDSETMVSKSLCLLNLLIRDEQRRAKNLLLVLKMREDALKDFTKSHILWLENKKKQDNTDISVLKKKQRGALLKLQFECGEMQRMRKALLTLSEKRKAALLKTKKNIELKLKSSVSVDQFLSGKRKLKKCTSDRVLAPIKCFELSSSGYEENNTHEYKTIKEPTEAVRTNDQCVQTGDSILENITSSSKDVTDEIKSCDDNCVIVDGAYMNILFHNLSLPKIFNQGKQYEVNEEALKNIVTSANIHVKLTETDVIEEFMDPMKDLNQDKSSSPSTARSLVEELDQIYKDFADDNQSLPDINYIPPTLFEVRDQDVQVSDLNSSNTSNSVELQTITSSSTVLRYENIAETFECQTVKGNEVIETASQAGSLPLPAGVADFCDQEISIRNVELPTEIISTSNSPGSSISSELASTLSSATSLAASSPAQSEAEELRRQQLAIEREIKALELQQNQLLVVREIPDKPPPPYTPPTEQRAPPTKPPRKFQADDAALEKLERHVRQPDEAQIDPTDAFDVFLKDFSLEILDRDKMDMSEDPWDACNLLPQKPDIDPEKLSKKAKRDLNELFSGVPQTVVTGVSNRRTDHIDDILFAEWKRCEPEWTALHIDEAVVKNQIFESIFQRVLTETIDQYKVQVLRIKSESDESN